MLAPNNVVGSTSSAVVGIISLCLTILLIALCAGKNKGKADEGLADPLTTGKSAPTSPQNGNTMELEGGEQSPPSLSGKVEIDGETFPAHSPTSDGTADKASAAASLPQSPESAVPQTDVSLSNDERDSGTPVADRMSSTGQLQVSDTTKDDAQGYANVSESKVVSMSGNSGLESPSSEEGYADVRHEGAAAASERSGATSPDSESSTYAKIKESDLTCRLPDDEDEGDDANYAKIAPTGAKKIKSNPYASIDMLEMDKPSKENPYSVLEKDSTGDDGSSRAMSPLSDDSSASSHQKENPYSSIRDKLRSPSKREAEKNDSADANPYSKVREKLRKSSHGTSPTSDDITKASNGSTADGSEKKNHGYARINIKSDHQVDNEEDNSELNELYARPSIKKGSATRLLDEGDDEDEPPPLVPKMEGANVLEPAVRHYRPGREQVPVDGEPAETEILYAMPTKGTVVSDERPPSLPPHPDSEDMQTLEESDDLHDPGYAMVNEDLRKELVRTRMQRSASAPPDPSAVSKQQRPKRYHKYTEIGAGLAEEPLNSEAGDPGYAEVSAELRAELLEKREQEGRSLPIPPHRPRQQTWSGRPMDALPEPPRSRTSSMHTESPLPKLKELPSTPNSEGAQLSNGAAANGPNSTS